MAELSKTFKLNGGGESTPATSNNSNKLSDTFTINNAYSTLPTISAPSKRKAGDSKGSFYDINEMLSDGHKLTKDEQKKVKDLYNTYSASANVGNNANAQRKYLESLSDSDRKLAMDVDKLYNKSSNIGSFFGGFLNAIPGYTKTTDKALDYLGVDDDYKMASQIKAQKEQNPIASTAGAMASKMAQYGLAKQIPVINKVSTGIGKSLGGSKVAEAIGNIGADTLVDLALDTTPELVGNIQNGKSAKETTIDALKNIGGNVGFNVVGELLGNSKEIARYVKNKNALKKANKIIDSTDDAIKSVDDIVKTSNDVVKTSNDTVKAVNSVTDATNDAVKETVKPLTNKEIENILNNPTAKAEFESANGIKLEGTKAEQRKQIKSLYDNASDIAVKKPTVVGNTDENTSTIKSTLEEQNGLNRSISPKDDFEINEDIGIKNPTLEGEMPWKEALSKTREKLVERGLATAEEAEKYMPEYEYVHKVMDISDTMSNAAKRVDEVGWEKVLDDAINTADDFISTEKYAELVESYMRLKAAGNLEDAAKVLQILTKANTPSAQTLRLAREFAQSTPEGKLAVAVSNAKHAVDTHKKAIGFSDAVDDMADALSDAIIKGDDKATKEILGKKLSDFTKSSRKKANLKDVQIDGQMSIFDFIQEEKAKGVSLSDIAEEAGRMLKKNADVVTISTKQEAEMLSLFEKMSYLEPDSYEYRQLQGQAMQILDKEMPSTLSAKVKTTLYDNMLGNFKTAISRNAGGNAVANALEQSQKPLRTLIDKAVSKATGTRNYVLDKDIAKARTEGFKKGLTEQISDIKSGIQTTRSGQNTLEDALDNVKTVYKGSNSISKALGKYDQIVKQTMQIGDRPFYEAEYAAAKKELQTIVEKFGKDAVQTMGVDDAINKSNIDDVIEFWARERALEAVFQNKSLSTQAFGKIKEGLANLSKDAVGVDLLSQTTMPFMQVPGNIFSRGLQYSPIGVLGNVVNTTKELATKSFNQKRFVDATSRNLTGLGLLGGAIALAQNGNVTGAYSDDADKAKAQKDAGELEYALKIGNKQIDVSDLPVIGQMLQAGSAVKDSMDDNNSLGRNIVAATKGANDAMLETSMLQGLNRLFGTDTYDKSGSIAQNVLNTVASGIPSQIVPSLVRQATQTVDTSKRDLGEYGSAKYYLNSAINSTPLRMALLKEKTDREGNVVKQNNGRNAVSRTLENFLLPYQISEPQYSTVTKEANRLFEENSGDTNGYIPSISKSSMKQIKGFDADSYSYDLYSETNKAFSKKSASDARKVISSNYYKGLSDSEKSDVLKKIYSANSTITKSNLARKGKSKSEIQKLEEEGNIYSYTDKFTKLLASDGIDKAMEYYQISHAPDINGDGKILKADIVDYLGKNYSKEKQNEWIDFLGYKR